MIKKLEDHLMGRKFKSFLDGFFSVFNVVPHVTHWKANHIKPVKENYPCLNIKSNDVPQNMQKIFTQDLGNALNQVKATLSEDELHEFNEISKIHNQAVNYYSNPKNKNGN